MFPRENGHAASHYVPGSVQTNKDLPDALEYLRNEHADLRRGDIIRYTEDAGYRNNGVVIFDGEKIVPLYYEVDDYDSLPQEFRVIEGEVPINYWHYGDDEGISHNTIVWFDHQHVREQALANIKFGKIETGDWMLYTTFVYNGKEYRIIIDPRAVKGTKDLTRGKLRKLTIEARGQLNSDELIVFGHTNKYQAIPTLLTEAWYD